MWLALQARMNAGSLARTRVALAGVLGALLFCPLLGCQEGKAEETEEEPKERKKKKSAAEGEGSESPRDGAKAGASSAVSGSGATGGKKRRFAPPLNMLRAEFKKNHKAATATYAGVEATYAGFVSMTIKNEFRFNETGAARQGFADILCRVDDAAVVAGLKVKDPVQVTGTITGTAFDVPGGNIEMKPCVVKKLKK